MHNNFQFCAFGLLAALTVFNSRMEWRRS